AFFKPALFAISETSSAFVKNSFAILHLLFCIAFSTLPCPPLSYMGILKANFKSIIPTYGKTLHNG
ncbi:MAG: hypothetical protein ACO2OT_00115, partial [Candidatus Caldipriscus sp.]